MALDSEIERIRKDTVRWRSLAQQLLTYAGHGALTDWELDFLENNLSKPWLDELSYRQGESLLVIRDGVELLASLHGYSTTYLVRACYENRFDLDDEDEAWLVEMNQSGRTAIRRKEAWRLFSLAKRIGEVEGDWAV